MAEHIASRWTGFRWIVGGAGAAYAASVQKDLLAVVICCFASGCLSIAGLLTLAKGR